MTDKQSLVVSFCKKNVNSQNWSPNVSRTSSDGKITFDAGMYKCNLFVYEALVSAGVKVPVYNKGGKNFPPNTEEWYNEKVSGFTCVGKGISALNKCWPGDIIVLYTTTLFGLIKTNHHMGIIIGPQKTCSAAGDQIIINDYGWRTNQWTDIKIFRYHS